MYTYHCNLNEKTGLARFRLGIWKSRGTRWGAEKGRCSVQNKDENVFLKCNQIQQWTEQFLHAKWPYINEETTYKKINCNKIKELKNFGIFLGKATCKCENKVTKMVQDIEEIRENINRNILQFTCKNLDEINTQHKIVLSSDKCQPLAFKIMDMYWQKLGVTRYT